MSPELSPRLAAIVDALPLRPGMRVMEVGCGPGAAARAVARRIEDGHVLAIDRSATAVRQTREGSFREIEAGRMQVRQVAVEDFVLEPGEAPYDLAFAVRVGALDGRHPQLEARAVRALTAALTPGGRLFVDGGDPLREVPLQRRVLLSWSTGKDCAWALKLLREPSGVEVVGLLTTVDAAADRVAMHGTRREILEVQARAVGLPLHVVPLPWPCPNAVYEERMARAVEEARGRGVTHMAFGDLFLEEVRAYREAQLAGSGITPLFPLWGTDTAALARQMVDAGVEAILTCVDPSKLPPDFAGRRFDHAFLDALPPGVDPCGENGEFHTCVLAGPMFQEAVRVAAPTPGARMPPGAASHAPHASGVVERDGFLFAEVLLEG
jgi:uncharacterized protein (TIGR00290 family)